jgi:hypothetical protein
MGNDTSRMIFIQYTSSELFIQDIDYELNHNPTSNFSLNFLNFKTLKFYKREGGDSALEIDEIYNITFKNEKYKGDDYKKFKESFLFKLGLILRKFK